MINRIWPTAVVGKADSVSSESASAFHIGGPNSVNPGQILLVYGTIYKSSNVLNKQNTENEFLYLSEFTRKTTKNPLKPPHNKENNKKLYKTHHGILSLRVKVFHGPSQCKTGKK